MAKREELSEPKHAKLVVPGVARSVKNEKMPSKGAVPKLIDKPEARKWKKWLYDYLVENYGNIKFDTRVSVYYKHYLPDMKRRDLSNMIQGIEDCMVRAGIIVDDSVQWYSISGVDGCIVKDPKNARCEVYIYESEPVEIAE